MDFKAFFADVVSWMEESNRMIAQYSILSDAYWEWAYTSSGKLSNKYGNHPLAAKQIGVLLEYLDGIYKQQVADKR